MSLNAELANLFQTAANVLDIKGGNPFRAISFAKVARILEDTTEDVRALVEQGTLEKINGIGSSSGKIIEDYVKTGRSADYEELLASIPPGLPELLNIPGLGPKTVSLLWHERQIESIDDLAKAIDAGKLEGVKGIGAKKIEAMKEGIALRLQAAERRGLPEAMKIAAGLRDKLLEMDQVRARRVRRQPPPRPRDHRRRRFALRAEGSGNGRHHRRVRGAAGGRKGARAGRDEDEHSDGGGLAGRFARRAEKVLRRGVALLHRQQGP